MSEDTLLPPSEQTEVSVRISHRTSRDRAFVGLIENDEVRSLKHVYNARSLLPAKFSDIKVPVINAAKRSLVITKGTELGILHAAKVIDEFQEKTKKKTNNGKTKNQVRLRTKRLRKC